MFGPLKSIWDFLNYWYFRYLMVTELYMVERWERVVCNMTILVIFTILSYANYIMLCYAKSFWNSGFSVMSTFS